MQNRIFSGAVCIMCLPSFSALIGFSPLNQSNDILLSLPLLLFSLVLQGKVRKKGRSFHGDSFCPAAHDIFYFPKHVKRQFVNGNAKQVRSTAVSPHLLPSLAKQ